MANTIYDIELTKPRSIVYLSLFFLSNLMLNGSVLNCRSFITWRISPNEYNMANELLASEK